MEISYKKYKSLKNKNFIKKNKLFFFYTIANYNCSDWITIEQDLKKYNLQYYRILNRSLNKNFKNSIFKYTKPTITSLTLFIKPKAFDNDMIINKAKKINLKILLAVKINNKIYRITQLNKTYPLKYLNSKLETFQYTNFNIKNSK